jgi:hypothetical protein
MALSLLGVGFLLLGGSLLDAVRKEADAMVRLDATAALVKKLELTDLVLFTEARYTRNLALTDRFSAFQDHPMALEHFPSGSVVGVPRRLMQAP